MSTIKIKCIEQTLQIINTPKIASGVQQVNSMQFEFCPTWEGFAKTAVFYRNENEVYNVLLANDECVIPNEVLQDQGRFYFGVFGIKDDLRLTSEVLKYDIVKGSFILGQEPEEPTPSIYEQILTQYGLIDEQYKEVKKQYENIYNDLAKTVANMPAKGFININDGEEVISIWVGKQAEYDALSEVEEGVYYVITDAENPYEEETNQLEKEINSIKESLKPNEIASIVNGGSREISKSGLYSFGVTLPGVDVTRITMELIANMSYPQYSQYINNGFGDLYRLKYLNNVLTIVDTDDNVVNYTVSIKRLLAL